MIKINFSGNEIQHTRFVFSGGEVQVKLGNTTAVDIGKFLSYPITFKIIAHITNSDEIMELALICDVLRRKYGSDIQLNLVLPYVPYARQDRAMTKDESLSLKVFSNFLNSLKFRSVEVWDAHSDVALALIDNVKHVPVDELLTPGSMPSIKDHILVSPDAGSLKKVSALAKKFSLNMVRADKTRSVIDGSITGTVVYSESVGEKHFLIVDDICDGGRTFIELAKELRKLTKGEVNLYVTHGIFSKGLQVVADAVDNIYCAMPFPKVNLKHPALHIIGPLRLEVLRDRPIL